MMSGISISLTFILIINYLVGTSSQDICAGKKPGEPFPSPENECDVYYTCDREEEFGPIDLFWHRCENGEHFSAEHLTCVHPDIALCAEKFQNLVCEHRDQRLSHPTNCSRYFECYTLSPLVIECTYPLHFSYDDQMCVAMQDSVCGDSPGENIYCGIFDDPMRPTLLAHPSDCGAFFKCFNGRPMPMLCPISLYFSVEKQRCEYPFYVNCKNGVRRNMF